MLSDYADVLYFTMTEELVRRIHYFALHCDLEGGADILPMRMAALPNVFIFSRGLWLPVASWTRRVGWQSLRTSSTDSC